MRARSVTSGHWGASEEPLAASWHAPANMLYQGKGGIIAERYCRNCGHELESEDNFCSDCGRPVHQTAHVPTPEADVPVPPPPQQARGAAPPRAEAPAPQAPGGRRGRTVLVGCLAVFLLLFLLVIAAALSGGGGDANQSGGEQGGGEPAPEDAEGPGETFTRANYAELVSDPDAHEGAKIDVTGRVFTAPEIVEGETAFQMFVDPTNSEWNTAVFIEEKDLELETDDYVHVVGTVRGSVEGENLFGGTVTAVGVEASKVEHVSAVSVVDPAQKTIQVDRTLTDQNFSITLKRIEFGEATTRAYVSAYNGTGTVAYFYNYDTKIIQGSRQFDQETTYDYEVKTPQSELNAGVRTDGVVTFGKVDPSQPMEVRFEWHSDNYNITEHPIVFKVTP